MVPKDAAGGCGWGSRDHPAFEAKEGDGRGGRDLDVIRFREVTGSFAPVIHFGVAVDQSLSGVKGRGGLVARDVHADQTVGVKGCAGQLLDVAGGDEHICFVP